MNKVFSTDGIKLNVQLPPLFLVYSFTDHPKITAHPLSDTKREGDNMTLSCNVTGNPVPIISWSKNGSPVDRNHNSRIRFSAGEKQLTITNVYRTDSGEYRCVARNSLGNDTSNASSVDIQCKYNVLLSQQNRSKTNIEVNKVRHTLTFFVNVISFCTKVTWSLKTNPFGVVRIPL